VRSLVGAQRSPSASAGLGLRAAPRVGGRMRACEQAMRLVSGIGVRRCRGHPACWMHAWARGVSAHRRGPRSYRPRRLVWHNAGICPLGSARLTARAVDASARPSTVQESLPEWYESIRFTLSNRDPRRFCSAARSRNNQSISLFALTP
jgi:hypothetical protein